MNIRFINGYQVTTALWLRDHTPARALVATHDIGAIGYFSGRQVIDLGGLTQPEIVPLLSDQRALIAYLKQQQVDYVVMFPDWFPPPRLLLAAVQQGQVFATHDPAIAAIGGSDLVTYQTGWGASAARSSGVPAGARELPDTVAGATRGSALPGRSAFTHLPRSAPGLWRGRFGGEALAAGAAYMPQHPRDNKRHSALAAIRAHFLKDGSAQRQRD